MINVTLQEMLDSREKRVLRQKELLAKVSGTLICFTLNIAGQVKVFPLVKKAFNEGIFLIRRQLLFVGCEILLEEQYTEKTGLEEYFIVAAEPVRVKQMMVLIEEDELLGRLFDVDVLCSDGRKISRHEIGLPERKCLICENIAAFCIHSQAHTLDEIKAKTINIMQQYLNNQFVDFVTQTAIKSLMYEVNVTPKPGLVDRHNNGAHSDMDIFTFIDSSTVLIPFFREFVLKGLDFNGNPEELFAKIRYIGKKAEMAMFEATGGVNTHKGLIFSLGILCAAAGYQYGKETLENTDSLLELSGEMASCTLNELKYITKENYKTHGERLYAFYGLTGIRGEAAGGFSAVQQFGLPILKKGIKDGLSLNDAGVLTLLYLIAHTQDTNIITRSNMKKQKNIHDRLQKLLKSDISSQELLETAKQLDNEFINEKISAGGSADLLAITFFLYFIESKLK